MKKYTGTGLIIYQTYINTEKVIRKKITPQLAKLTVQLSFKNLFQFLFA